jgi:hypothetical protein
VSGRQEYTDPPEKFEHFAMMLFEPFTQGGAAPTLKLIDAISLAEISEQEYFQRVREIYNKRNPHAIIEELQQS